MDVERENYKCQVGSYRQTFLESDMLNLLCIFGRFAGSDPVSRSNVRVTLRVIFQNAVII